MLSVMPRDWLRRYLPSRHAIRRQKLLGPVRHLLADPELWHLHRRSAGGACFIGLFCAFVPVPGQTLLAAAFAIVFRCNLPIAVVTVWLTNPLTAGPMFFFAYKLGAWLLDVQVTTGFNLSWDWLWSSLGEIWGPFLLGCLVCAWVTGLTGLVASRLLWRMHIIRRWKERRQRRRARRVPPAPFAPQAARELPLPAGGAAARPAAAPRTADGVASGERRREESPAGRGSVPGRDDPGLDQISST